MLSFFTKLKSIMFLRLKKALLQYIASLMPIMSAEINKNVPEKINMCEYFLFKKRNSRAGTMKIISLNLRQAPTAKTIPARAEYCFVFFKMNQRAIKTKKDDTVRGNSELAKVVWILLRAKIKVERRQIGMLSNNRFDILYTKRRLSKENRTTINLPAKISTDGSFIPSWSKAHCIGKMKAIGKIGLLNSHAFHSQS